MVAPYRHEDRRQGRDLMVKLIEAAQLSRRPYSGHACRLKAAASEAGCGRCERQPARLAPGRRSEHG